MPRTFIRDFHQQGINKAWDSFFHRRHLPILGYVVLTAAIAYAIDTNHQTATTNDKRLETRTREVLIQDCERGNQLRSSLQYVVKLSATDYEAQIKRGIFPKSSEVYAQRAIKRELNAFATLDCSKAYARLKDR